MRKHKSKQGEVLTQASNYSFMRILNLIFSASRDAEERSSALEIRLKQAEAEIEKLKEAVGEVKSWSQYG